MSITRAPADAGQRSERASGFFLSSTAKKPPRGDEGRQSRVTYILETRRPPLRTCRGPGSSAARVRVSHVRAATHVWSGSKPGRPDRPGRSASALSLFKVRLTLSTIHERTAASPPSPPLHPPPPLHVSPPTIAAISPYPRRRGSSILGSGGPVPVEMPPFPTSESRLETPRVLRLFLHCPPKPLNLLRCVFNGAYLDGFVGDAGEGMLICFSVDAGVVRVSGMIDALLGIYRMWVRSFYVGQSGYSGDYR